MLSLTRKSDYALVAMVSLAERSNELHSARDLSDRLRLPPAALRNILKDLARAGLLESIQGAAGGYRLARPAPEISLAEIIQAIEGPVKLTSCCGDGSEPESDGCRRETSCRIKATVRALNLKLTGFLSSVTLDALAQETHTEQPTVSGVRVAVATPIHGATA